MADKTEEQLITDTHKINRLIAKVGLLQATAEVYQKSTGIEGKAFVTKAYSLLVADLIKDIETPADASPGAY